ncbi:TIM barrel protein [bacterium]|nr:TIM barrel protein [bacterium]
MPLILATVALEPNRWSADHHPAGRLLELLGPVRAAGFDQLEVWQWHATTPSLAALREIRARADQLGVRFPYLAAYPKFHLDGEDARAEEHTQQELLERAEILGCRALKIMLGAGLKGGDATPEQLTLTADQFGRWYQAGKDRGLAMCAELHGNTMFDPVEAGERFLAEHPELDFTICFQARDFTDTAGALALADRFAGRISHIHLQAPHGRHGGGGYDLLADGTLDYRRVLPHVLSKNPDATMTLEFVKDCLQPAGSFDLDRVLANARQDQEFVEKILQHQNA